MRGLERRDFLRSGLVTIGAALAGPAIWRSALAAPAQPGSGPYGPLGPPDENGLRLPEGFRSRVVARSGRRVGASRYEWHRFPDGGAAFPVEGGGWIYVSNSEVSGTGGVGALRFSADGSIADAYPILEGTSRNCAGGPTPWGTWLSCEEVATGRVFECDPSGRRAAVPRPALGVFTHEAVAVDPAGRRLYLTEDRDDGGLYRFTPDTYPDLATGVLEIARVEDLDAVRRGGSSPVTWREIPDPANSGGTPTRRQVKARTPFDGGEGCWFDAGVVYFTTKGDNRVWAYDTVASSIELFYDDDATSNPILNGVDNVFVSPRSGDVFVAEDGGDLDIVLITPDRRFTRFSKLVGPAHAGSEITGPALNPAGDRLYFSSQRSFVGGVTYEVRGPFRKTRVSPSIGPTPTVSATPPSPQPPQSPPPAASDGIGGVLLTGAAALGAAAAVTGAIRLRNRRRGQ
jgi:secreted PhoX family phosphatase